MNATKFAVAVFSTAFGLSLIVACSSSSTSSGGSAGDGGTGSGSDGSASGGNGNCQIANGTYTIHYTATDLSDGGATQGCTAPSDITITYPIDASDTAGFDAGLTCTVTTDTSTCTTTSTCMNSGAGGITTNETTVITVNASGTGSVATITTKVVSGGGLVEDCQLTATTSPAN